jgi:PAS domain S-box-containing protein
MPDLIRVVIGDDNAFVLAGLRSIFEAEPDLRVVAGVMDGEQLWRAVERCRPDVAVVEVRMPVVDGLTCLRHIRRLSPETKVLMLTAHADGQTLHSVIRAGADGLLLKSDPPGQTIQGVREVMAGAMVLPAAARQWLGGGPKANRFDPLSERESEVLGLVAQGLSNRQVAEQLFVSENTVKFHLQNVFQRLAVANRTEASRWFLRSQEASPQTDFPARLRVLVVEDEAIVAEEIRDRLERLRVEVVGVADTGEQAIQAAAETRPDLVLMDIRLKGALDGIQTAAILRERFDVPVVYLTAHSDPSTLDRAMQGASFGYVLKPFQEKDLRIAIASAVSRARAEQALKEKNAGYAAMLASIADAVVAVDAYGQISFLNAAAEAITGWLRNEALGRPMHEVFQLIDGATREEMESPAARALRRSAAVLATHDALLIDRHGVAIPVESSAAPIPGARGQLAGAVMVIRDLRPRRRRSEAARQAEGELPGKALGRPEASVR